MGRGPTAQRKRDKKREGELSCRFSNTMVSPQAVEGRSENNIGTGGGPTKQRKRMIPHRLDGLLTDGFKKYYSSARGT